MSSPPRREVGPVSPRRQSTIGKLLLLAAPGSTSWRKAGTVHQRSTPHPRGPPLSHGSGPAARALGLEIRDALVEQLPAARAVDGRYPQHGAMAGVRLEIPEAVHRRGRDGFAGAQARGDQPGDVAHV